MNINELNQMRDRMHKQFVNRQQADENTVVFYVGIGDGGVTKEAEKVMLALTEQVAEKSNDALVMFDTSFTGGVKVKKSGEVKTYEGAVDAAALVAEYFG